MRRKKKIVHKAASADDKKLQSQLKKLSVNPIPGIEEVNMFKDDGTILNFSNPKVPDKYHFNYSKLGIIYGFMDRLGW